ncbi:hypothetical protein GME_17868 [Halomonas sp. TD01]|nr:hypothetical protein GME_17868 [Halomonas sp. TD01]
MMAFDSCPVGMMLPQVWFAPELQHRTEMAKGKTVRGEIASSSEWLVEFSVNE